VEVEEETKKKSSPTADLPPNHEDRAYVIFNGPERHSLSLTFCGFSL
jgi:hypothetical protein